MSETGSCLAIVENKPQRLGGCVGIFSQLFDWNRKFAKKKLFPKKLLPPVGLKKASKKFGGDEKQPKLHLIADENSGGFPNAMKNDRDTNSDLVVRRETRAPSLIARLMGLESMPQVQRKKAKKVVESSSRNDDSVLIGENAGFKNEPRPQKLQKTSCSEKRAVTKFGSDTLQFKSVLSRSKKYHHPKLPVPVKSPGSVSRRNSSKLIGAATRILEPGLQTSRSKCALTYSNSSSQPSKLIASVEDSDHFPCVDMKEQPSYRNCGHSLDKNLNAETCFHKEPIDIAPSSNCVGFCSPVSEKSKPDQSFYEEIEEPLEGLPSSSRSTHQNPIYQSNHSVPSRSKFSSAIANGSVTTTVVNERRSFVLPNRSINGNSRRDNYKFEMEKKIYDRLSDIVPPGRKRRPTNIPKHAESSIFMSSTSRRQEHCNPRANSTRDFGYNVHYASQQCRDFSHLQLRTPGSFHEGNKVASFTFNSSAKQKTRVHAVEKRRVQTESGSSRRVQKSDLKENGTIKSDKQIPLSGDALSALLEQKLKELNSQGDDTRSNVPKKSTAVILQELISALTSEMSFMQNKTEATRECNSSKSNELGSKLSVDPPIDYEHLSPGSVLEAFSNESCLSSNHDDNLGFKMPSESVDCYSFPYPRSFKRYPEFSDSSNSVTAKSVIEIIDLVSETLCSINLTNGLNGCKLDHTQEILVNSELIFRSATHSSPFLQRGYSIKHLFVEIETLATVLWMKFGSSLGVEDCEEVRRFAFDSIIEYLELRCETYLTFGSKALTRLPLCMNANMLVFEIIEEVRRWKELSGFVLDELIDMEMSRSSKDWTLFEHETFETSVDISQQVLQCLLDEILNDLCDC